MSNHLAIATVTETLRQFIETACQSAVSGATATVVRPSMAGIGLPNPGVNLFLYHVTPNAAWRNSDLPQRNGNGLVSQRPRVGYDLHYLLSFYGREIVLEPQRLLGRTLQALQAQPGLSRRQIRDTVVNASFLAGSNLAEDIEAVKLTLQPTTLDELSKMWSVFYQATYALSVVFQATVVLIESDIPESAPLPVRQRFVQAIPFRRPYVDALSPTILNPGDTLTLRGRNLRANQVKVRMDRTDLAPADTDVADTEIRIAVPANSPAGIHTTQVLQFVDFGSGTPSEPHRLFESNVTPFMVRPRLQPPNAAEPAFGAAPRGGQITVNFSPTIGPTQDVFLIIGDRSVALPPRAPNSAPIGQATFSIPLSVALGNQLVRLQVDGAQSELVPAAGTPITGPLVQLIPALVSSGIALAAVAGGVDARVIVQDDTGQPVAGANVSGKWVRPDLTTQNDAQPTDAAGVATFHLASADLGTFTFTVTDIAAANAGFTPNLGVTTASITR